MITTKAPPCDIALDDAPSDVVQAVIDVMRGFGFEVIAKSDFDARAPIRVYGTIDNAACLIEELLTDPAPKVARRDAPQWSKAEPTEQGDYWHWDGNPDYAPAILSVLYSGTAKRCFVAMNCSFSGQAEFCNAYGGYWLRIPQPKLPNLETIARKAP